MNIVHYIFSVFLTCTLLFVGGCASPPPNGDNPTTYALQDTADTHMGEKYRALKEGNPDDSGFFLLGNGLDAFVARAALAQVAERSIDVQYYMIHNDLTGALFAEQLLKAADRGIRVRVLIDDMDLEGRDTGLSAFAVHPNIELRIFNPFDRQTMRVLQFITRFGAVTRRMHNKSFTVDNQATIVGGRNIGDEYFEADPLLTFADLDILAIGPVVKEVSASFDEYWNSSLAYPIAVLRPDLNGKNDQKARRKKLEEYLGQNSVTEYLQALEHSSLVNAIKNHEVTYTWGKARVYSDHPDKLKSYEEDKTYDLAHKLGRYFDEVHKELIIFSPYFVPGKKGTETLTALSKRGVRVRILTNSLASTDVGVVHAGYAKYRRELLRAGVELYEMNKRLSKAQRKERNSGKKRVGSSKASLHAKSFIFDRKQIFVGSLNLDPRSVTENTEIGIMVTSKEIANDMAKAFDLMTTTMAFRLELNTDEDGMELISWHGKKKGKEHVWPVEPNTGFWQRLGIFFISLLPIESQL